ncbi:MAG: STAS domain-containing protein [Desulfobulbaceae bacterium]|nr:STAS domain-containing protein [Desulfobulbaceae bacterium]
MKYPSQQHGSSMIISLTGEVDLKFSPLAREQILKSLSDKSHVLVDLSEVEYIDSSGVASLVEGLQYARNHRLHFALTGVSEPAMQVLHLARLDQVFTIHPNVEEGLDAFAREDG